MKAIVSIHDVTPTTLHKVERILTWLEQRDVPPVTLLVVPGQPWEAKQIERVRALAAAGHELAAHGWAHKTRPSRAYHRLHAALISRNVAEHLALPSAAILGLMQRSSDWFGQNGLPLPAIYVPPAWALGPITRADLAQVPYRLIEITGGLLIDQTARAGSAPTENTHGENHRRFTFRRLPLTGYEADNIAREYFLRGWNRWQARVARQKNLPLRISIHPDDPELRVADQMARQIESARAFENYLDACLKA